MGLEHVRVWRKGADVVCTSSCALCADFLGVGMVYMCVVGRYACVTGGYVCLCGGWVCVFVWWVGMVWCACGQMWCVHYPVPCVQILWGGYGVVCMCDWWVWCQGVVGVHVCRCDGGWVYMGYSARVSGRGWWVRCHGEWAWLVGTVPG